MKRFIVDISEGCGILWIILMFVYGDESYKQIDSDYGDYGDY